MKHKRLTSNYWAFFLADYLNHKITHGRVNEKDMASLLYRAGSKSDYQKWVCSFLVRAVENYFYRFDLVHKELHFQAAEKIYTSWGLTIHTLLNYSFNYTLKLAKQLNLFNAFNLDQLVAILGKSRTAYHSLGQQYKSGKDSAALGWQLGTKTELIKTLKKQYPPAFLETLLALVPVKDIRFFQNAYLETESQSVSSDNFVNKYQTRHIRVNLLSISRDELLDKFRKEKIDAQKSPYNPWGIHVKGIYNLYKNDLYQQHLYEIQDDSTQLAVQFVDPKPGTRILDYCAGNGSKTLGYAVCMKNKGTITATDTHEFQINEIKLRARAAGHSNIQTLTREELSSSGKDGKFDTVIADVPCTGTGALEKHSEKRSAFSRNDLRELVSLQSRILEEAVPYVAPGGQLVYMTTSLLQEENEQMVSHFLEQHTDYTLFLPQSTQNDFNNFITKKNHLSTIKYMPHMQGVFVAFLSRKS